jgi:hypothetical protein
MMIQYFALRKLFTVIFVAVPSHKSTSLLRFPFSDPVRVETMQAAERFFNLDRIQGKTQNTASARGTKHGKCEEHKTRQVRGAEA